MVTLSRCPSVARMIGPGTVPPYAQTLTFCPPATSSVVSMTDKSNSRTSVENGVRAGAIDIQRRQRRRPGVLCTQQLADRPPCRADQTNAAAQAADPEQVATAQ